LTALIPVAVGVAAAVPIAAYLWVALHRVGYPFELDWMEGGSVELAARALAGHSLYAAPTLRFVGWTYPPLYYWLAAAVAKLTGIGFLPLRLVSLLASLVSMATLGWIVARETGNRVAGLLAAGLFAATFQISGAWFDTGRVDSLFLALTLLALAAGRRASRVWGGIGLGALIFLAFFTKQSALLALAPMLAYLVITRRRVGIPALTTLVVALVASTVVVDAFTDGWYRYYVFSELAHQPWARSEWIAFWRGDILGRQWPLVILLIGGVTLARHGTRRPPLRSWTTYYALGAAGLIGSAWISRLHTGGYDNVLMPAYAAIALLAGLTYGRLLAARPGRIVAPLLLVVVLVQLGLLVYPISAQIPTAADRAAGATLIARLRALPGPVVVLRHPWYATVVGKGAFAQAEAMGDVLRSAATRGGRALRASLAGALNANGVQAVVLDGTFDARLLGPELARDFRLQRTPITPSRLYPLTDVHTAPTLLYVRVRST
ncbi:MAG: glycosyltransferase family 39 protein, partial [Solirubrobacteraceae bacterium]